MGSYTHNQLNRGLYFSQTALSLVIRNAFYSSEYLGIADNGGANLLYVVEHDGEWNDVKDMLYCVNMSGSELWKIELPGQPYRSSICGNIAYIYIMNESMQLGKYVALDITEGRIKNVIEEQPDRSIQKVYGNSDMFCAVSIVSDRNSNTIRYQLEIVNEDLTILQSYPFKESRNFNLIEEVFSLNILESKEIVVITDEGIYLVDNNGMELKLNIKEKYKGIANNRSVVLRHAENSNNDGYVLLGIAVDGKSNSYFCIIVNSGLTNMEIYNIDLPRNPEYQFVDREGYFSLLVEKNLYNDDRSKYDIYKYKIAQGDDMG